MRNGLICKWPALVALISIIACNHLPMEQEQVSLPLQNDYQVRRNEINTYLEINKGYTSTKASCVSVEPVLCNSDTVFYIVNYEKGWEVLSGDKRAPRVLVKCDGGNITKDNLYSSPAQSAFFQALETNLSKALHDDDFYASADISDSWLSCADTSIIRERVLPFYPRIERVLISIDRTKYSTVPVSRYSCI